MAFLGTAYLTILMVLTHYLFVPQHNANGIDRCVLNGFWRALLYISKGKVPLPSEEFGKGLRGPVLMFSDQQIVTGIGIMFASLYQMNNCGLSAYHWQIAVYLAWFSSITHLATLTLLRDYMVFNTGIRLFRLALMLVLFVMLLVALLPTGGKFWLWPSLWQMTKGPGASHGVPAKCFYGALLRLHPNDYFLNFFKPSMWVGQYSNQFAGMVGSLIFLVFNYITRTIKIFRSASQFTRRWFRTKPGNLVKRWMASLSRKSVSPDNGTCKRGLAATINNVILVNFTVALAILDLYDSMLMEVNESILWSII